MKFLKKAIKMQKCPFCDFEAKNIYGLKRHITKKHNNDYCPLCKKYFKSLEGHIFQKHKDYFKYFQRKKKKKKKLPIEYENFPINIVLKAFEDKKAHHFPTPYSAQLGIGKN
jgi:hypothetical protein